MSSNGAQAVQVTRKGGYAAFESPDGKWLYYSKDFFGSSLWKVPVEGGEEGVFFNSAGGTSIQFFNFVTERTTLIAKSEKPAANGLTISPDRQWILFVQADQFGSDLMLVENFR
jgi:WD40 repeat protein